MREICMSGSTRERGAAVIDAIVFHSVLSSLLYRLRILSGRRTERILTCHSRQKRIRFPTPAYGKSNRQR